MFHILFIIILIISMNATFHGIFMRYDKYLTLILIVITKKECLTYFRINNYCLFCIPLLTRAIHKYSCLTI